MTPEEIAEDYGISVEDVKAALLYAAKVLGREEVLIDTETSVIPMQTKEETSSADLKCNITPRNPLCNLLAP